MSHIILKELHSDFVLASVAVINDCMKQACMTFSQFLHCMRHAIFSHEKESMNKVKSSEVVFLGAQNVHTKIGCLS